MLTVNGGTDRVGIKDSSPISELSVAGMISITEEQGSTPSAPADGHGFLYTKSDGKLYWRSADLGETDLTVGDTDTLTPKQPILLLLSILAMMHSFDLLLVVRVVEHKISKPL